MSPRVSIGLPVYNGENYLQEAVESILNQTYTDFELIISDNASTDRTEEFCRAYEKQDHRVRYFRNAKNLGIAKNYNLTYELSSKSSELFKWAAHDDILLPDYLSRCVSVLDEDPTIICVHTYTQKIDQHGERKHNYPDDQFVNSAETYVRLYDAICVNHQVIVGHAVIRKSVLDKTQLYGAYPGSDFALQAELALHGRLYEIPEYLFLRRSHPHRAYRVPLYDRIAVEDPTKAGKIILPAWKQWFDYFSGIHRADLPFSEKLRCHIQALKCVKRGVLFYPLLRDLKWASSQFLRKNGTNSASINSNNNKEG